MQWRVCVLGREGRVENSKSFVSKTRLSLSLSLSLSDEPCRKTGISQLSGDKAGI